jgi:branched-chain amino acid transport system ATP-binding protein
MTQNTSLAVDGLRKTFSGIVAIDDVSFTVESESIVGIIGPNGAGKTTLINLLSGFYEQDTGTIRFNGADISDASPHERTDEGLIRTFQITRELSGMTVLDNLLLADQNPRHNSVLKNIVSGDAVDDDLYEQAREWLEELGLWRLRHEYAGNLSGGQQKLLELGRALIADPDLLLLDEPMAGVNPALTDQLCGAIQALNDDGMTFMIIEHDMDVIMNISDEIIALADGRLLTRGPPAVVKQNSELLQSYLGGA